jgi:hypothetical protein
MFGSRFLKPPFVHCLGLLVLLAVSAACATADAGSSRDASVAADGLTSNVAPSSLADAIAAGMEGAQLDVFGGGRATPGATTTMFVHHGDRAAEAYWTTDGWCLSRVYTWSVENVVSATEFDVRYDVQQQYTDCVMDWGRQLVLHVTDVDHLVGQTSYVGAYTSPFQTATVRTKCTSRWNTPSPCGFSEASAVLPEL